MLMSPEAFRRKEVSWQHRNTHQNCTCISASKENSTEGDLEAGIVDEGVVGLKARMRTFDPTPE